MVNLESSPEEVSKTISVTALFSSAADHGWRNPAKKLIGHLLWRSGIKVGAAERADQAYITALHKKRLFL